MVWSYSRHPLSEKVLFIVHRLHYIVYLLKVAAMWRRVWSLAPILLVSRSFSLSRISTRLCTCWRWPPCGGWSGAWPPSSWWAGPSPYLESPLYCVPVEGGRHVEDGVELGPHPPGEQVHLLIQCLHYIVYLLKVAAMWRRVWSLAPILLVSRSFSLSKASLRFLKALPLSSQPEHK